MRDTAKSSPEPLSCCFGGGGRKTKERAKGSWWCFIAMPRMQDVFEEEPSDWPSMETLMKPKERVHTYYRTSDIVKRFEDATDFSGDPN